MEKSKEERSCSNCEYEVMGTCKEVKSCHNHSKWKAKAEVKNCSTCVFAEGQTDVPLLLRPCSTCEADVSSVYSKHAPRQIQETPKAPEGLDCSSCALHEDQDCLSIIPCRKFDQHTESIVETPIDCDKDCSNCGCKNKDGDCSEVMNCSGKSNWTPKPLEMKPEEKPKNSFSSTKCSNCSNTNAGGGCDSFVNTGCCNGYSEKEMEDEGVNPAGYPQQNEKSCNTCKKRLSCKVGEGHGNFLCWEAHINTHESHPEGIDVRPKAEEIRTCGNCYNVLKSQMGMGCEEQDCAGFSHWRAKVERPSEEDKDCQTCQNFSDVFSSKSPHIICDNCFNLSKWEKLYPNILSQPVKGKAHTVEVLDDIIIGLKHYVLSYKDSLRREDGVFLYAEINYRDLSIVVNAECNKLQQKDSLLHECIHGIDEYNGIGLSENQITGLATNFLEFIKHNKGIIKYLMED